MGYTLTNNGKKAIAEIYACYLRRIDDGEDMIQAKGFVDLEYLKKEVFDNYSDGAMHSGINELKRVFHIKVYTSGTFLLNDEIVAYMESLKWSTFLDGIEVAAKVKAVLKLIF